MRSSSLLILNAKDHDSSALEDDKFRHQLRGDMPFPPIHFSQN